MRKYIEYIVLFLFLLSCSSKVEILTGDSQYQPFAPDGIPFVVADSMWNVDMRGNHRAVVRVSDINSNMAPAGTSTCMSMRRDRNDHSNFKLRYISAVTPIPEHVACVAVGI